MRYLAIDCATAACSAALFVGKGITPVMGGIEANPQSNGLTPIGEELEWRLTAHDYRDIGRGHAEQLIPMIKALPDQGRADVVCVALGPGSFTGVRIGIAAARALALSWGAKLYGYPTLALIAAEARAKAGPQPLTVSMEGGHGEWFVQSFAENGAADSPLFSLSPAKAVNKLPNDLVAGSTAQQFAQFRSVNKAINLLPDSKSLAFLQIQHFTPVISPIYGREPDARIAVHG